MRGPRCGYGFMMSAIERTMAAVQQIADESQRAGLRPDLVRVHSPEMRARLAEMNLSLHEMRNHIESCEECEQL